MEIKHGGGARNRGSNFADFAFGGRELYIYILWRRDEIKIATAAICMLRRKEKVR